MKPISRACRGENGWPKSTRGKAKRGKAYSPRYDMIAAGARPWVISGKQREAVAATRGKSVTMGRPMPKAKASPWTSATEVSEEGGTRRLSSRRRGDLAAAWVREG